MTNANALPIQDRLAFMANLLDQPADANLSQTCRDARDRIDALETALRDTLRILDHATVASDGADEYAAPFGMSRWLEDEDKTAIRAARAALGEGD